ncbi:MAG: hypothetical protein ACW99G_03190 [Candidatus Thorarchaeota archaeon]|jgi:hypothetical protein
MADNVIQEKHKVDKIFAVITVARQIEGEYVFIKTEKAFTSASSADTLLKNLKAQYVTQDGKSKPQTITTSQGVADCHCEVGAFELEIEGDLWVTNG